MINLGKGVDAQAREARIPRDFFKVLCERVRRQAQKGEAGSPTPAHDQVLADAFPVPRNLKILLTSPVSFLPSLQMQTS